jgi:hypothetical protein
MLAMLALVMVFATAGTLIARPAPVFAGTTQNMPPPFQPGSRCDPSTGCANCQDAFGNTTLCAGPQFAPQLALPNLGQPPMGAPPVFVNLGAIANPGTVVATNGQTVVATGQTVATTATGGVAACMAKLSPKALAEGLGYSCQNAGT